jgi:hypothetical protein
MRECGPPVLYATVTAIVLGGLIGAVRGGSLSRLGQLHIRLAWLAGVAWLAQVLLFASPLGAVLDPWAVGIHLATIVLVGVVIVANRNMPGVAAFGLGLLLNAAVIGTNGGYMPVSAAAVTAVGDSASLAALERGDHVLKAVLMQPDSPLWFLGDVLPVPPLRKIYSPGDVIAALGALLLVAQGMGSRAQLS